MAAGTLKIEKTGRYDKYGRALAEVFIDGINLQDAMMGAGLATYYRD
jgi:endonuclease YncB( thermonuclease family)